MDADNLVVDESYLFGRAALSEKISSDLQNQTLPLEDWTNMVFGGTYVISGQGYAIAVATGEQLAINDSNHKIPIPLYRQAYCGVETRLMIAGTIYFVLLTRHNPDLTQSPHHSH